MSAVRKPPKPGAGTLDDEIARQIAEAETSGELEAAPSYGKPLDEVDGWRETPAALRINANL